MQLRNGEVSGRQTPVGIVPTKEELQLEGMELDQDDLDTILSIDIPRWQQEMAHREQHLSLFRDLPEEIWAAHRRVADALDSET
jgi:phosphoenolpyruvate carboxykinase (GTP)